jgi:predicted HicB family RNase H-like nuclease
VRASVLLHPDLHKQAKLAAIEQGVSLSDLIAALVATNVNWRHLK